jgi:hypothetical protein
MISPPDHQRAVRMIEETLDAGDHTKNVYIEMAILMSRLQ